MKKEEIHLDDIKRILFGQTPPEFLLEVLLRTFIIYVACLFFIKWVGKRMSGQISITEMVVMILIGAIISVPVQFYERGLLQGFMLLLAILFIYNGLNWLGYKREKAERLIQGEVILLIKDNVLQLDNMSSAKISKDQVFSILRNKKIFNLGHVKRMYLEACGRFSVYEGEAKPGLPAFPEDDKFILIEKSDTQSNQLVCSNCGFTKEVNYTTDLTCKYCGSKELVKACNS